MHQCLFTNTGTTTTPTDSIPPSIFFALPHLEAPQIHNNRIQGSDFQLLYRHWRACTHSLINLCIVRATAAAAVDVHDLTEWNAQAISYAVLCSLGVRLWRLLEVRAGLLLGGGLWHVDVDYMMCDMNGSGERVSMWVLDYRWVLLILERLYEEVEEDVNGVRG